MRFKFLIEYIDLKEDMPLHYGYTDEGHDVLGRYVIHKKWIRAKNAGQAIQKFTEMYPEFQVIGWR